MLFRSNTTRNISKIVEKFRVYLGWDPVIIFRCFVSSCWGLVIVYWSLVSFLCLYFTYRIFRATSAALIRGRRLFKGGAYLDIYFFLYSYSTVHFLSFIFSMDWSKLIVNRVRFTRWKNTRESHDNESENISGESITGAALIRVNTVIPWICQVLTPRMSPKFTWLEKLWVQCYIHHGKCHFPRQIIPRCLTPKF